jgi:hypothetical protein
MLALVAAAAVLELAIDPASNVRALPVNDVVEEVRAIWRPYVNITLRSPDEEAIAGRPALQLRILDRAAKPREGESSLGWIEFVDGQPQPLITISAAEARRTLATAPWLGRPIGDLPARVVDALMARVIGRVVAHEVGHYVLGAESHARDGLMRPSFSARDLVTPDRSRFRPTVPSRTWLAALLAGPIGGGAPATSPPPT